MRNFIKQEIQSRLNESAKNNAPESVSTEAILEYASEIPELGDLSAAGTEAEARTLSTEIPLKEDEDAEIEKIEYDLGTGNVDVNKDATVASVTESYTGIKSYEEFYQEAADYIARLPRESEAAHEKRVAEYADKLYNEYCEEAKECGFHGFDKISITEASVPSKINVNFGPMSAGSTDNFVTKVNTFFATDDQHNITKKQLDSVSLVKMGALKKIGEPLKAYMESTYNVDSETSVWDVCTPKTIIVPKGNADSFCVVVEYTNEITGKDEYYGWTAPVTDKDENITMESCEKFNMESFVTETHYENKDVVVQEMAELEATKEAMRARRVRPSRFYQEAIEGVDTSTEEPAADTSTDAPAEEPAADASAEGGETSVETSGGDKETAAVNDVSSEIADKVAADTQGDAMAEDETITFSDETNPTDNVGVADAGDVDETSVEGEDAGIEGDDAAIDDADAALSELDDTASDTDESIGDDLGGEEDEEGALDVDNVDDMSVNQLLELGKESLKDMKVGDLKNLIANKSDEEIQEAFIYTSKNINKELNIKLRKCLGILNDNKDNADAILKKFKGEGHSLNRALSKAAGMKKVYSSDEIKVIKDLNEALAQLLLVLRKKPENYGSMVKGKISDFTNAAKKLGTIINDKLDKGVGDTGEVMQEGFVQEGLFLSSGNAKKRLARKVAPVYADMGSIVKSAEGGVLNKGKINKMYKPAKKTRKTAWEAGDSGGLGFSSSREVDINTPHSENINDLQRILSKIIRKPKVQEAFTSDEMTMISDVTDLLDDFVDMVESVIYDANSDNQIIVDKIGEIAKKIMDLLQKINDVCTSTPIDSTNVEDEGLMNATPDEGLDEDVNIPEDPETGEDIEDDEAEVEVEPEAEESEESDDDDDDKDEEGEDE